MTRMVGPDCAVMCNLINTRTHHKHTQKACISHYVQACIGHYVRTSIITYKHISVITYNHHQSLRTMETNKVNAKQVVVKVLTPGHT